MTRREGREAGLGSRKIELKVSVVRFGDRVEFSHILHEHLLSSISDESQRRTKERTVGQTKKAGILTSWMYF